MFCKKGVLRNFANFAGLSPATLLKKSPWHRCFPVNFVKFLRTPTFIEHLWWLLLYIVILDFIWVIAGYLWHGKRKGLIQRGSKSKSINSNNNSPSVHQTNPMEFHLKQESIFKYDHVKFTVHSCLQGRAISQIRLSQAKSEKGGKIKAWKGTANCKLLPESTYF